MHIPKEKQKWIADYEIDRDIDSAAVQQSKIARSYFLLGRYPKNATDNQISDFKANVLLWQTQDDPETKKKREINEIASHFFRFGELPKDANNELIIDFLVEIILPINKQQYDQLAFEHLGW